MRRASESGFGSPMPSATSEDFFLIMILEVLGRQEGRLPADQPPAERASRAAITIARFVSKPIETLLSLPAGPRAVSFAK